MADGDEARSAPKLVGVESNGAVGLNGKKPACAGFACNHFEQGQAVVSPLSVHRYTGLGDGSHGGLPAEMMPAEDVSGRIIVFLGDSDVTGTNEIFNGRSGEEADRSCVALLERVNKEPVRWSGDPDRSRLSNRAMSIRQAWFCDLTIDLEAAGEVSSHSVGSFGLTSWTEKKAAAGEACCCSSV
ncbi:MAG TPA: hypothetical protein VMQ76_00650 [Terracidiphilus sp.]|nr:hypothetical protein [Terracidiphilus sp.]